MSVLAFIPARGGSKRVPGKNLRKVNGVSLVRRAVECAWGAGLTAVVSSDDWAVFESATGLPASAELIDAVTTRGVAEALAPVPSGWRDLSLQQRWAEVRSHGFHLRPPALADDHARVEDAIAHYLAESDAKPDVIVLLQPTSPLRTAEHVREALALMETTRADTLVSVCVRPALHFVGSLRAEHVWDPCRLPDMKRPRSQDATDLAHENGAIYAVTRAHFERTGSLHGGHSVAYVMDRWASIDVDEEDDLEHAALVERWRRDAGRA